MTVAATLRREAEDLLSSYTTAIDDGEIDRWPKFFADPCLYKIVSRENFVAGLPLALVLCDSPGMVRDRAEAFSELNVFSPRAWRHLTGPVSLVAEGELTRARSNFVIFETLSGQSTHVLCAGEYRDVLIRHDGALKFRERLCIYDTTMIPNSIVMPI